MDMNRQQVSPIANPKTLIKEKTLFLIRLLNARRM